MNKTLSKVIASAMVAVTLMTVAPVTASAANANNTTTSSSTSASASASTSTYKTMYAIKSVYSYKRVNGKLVKSTAVYKGTALKVKSSRSKYYILSDGRYIKKTAVGAKRINWTDIKYSKPLTRYISKDNTKARAGALTSSKVSTTLDKGTQVTIVARTTSGFYKLDDGSYILQTSTTKTKPATSTTTNSQYPNDKYGPGENGYKDIVRYNDYAGDGSNWDGYIAVEGYVFENGLPAVEDYTKEGIEAIKKTEGIFTSGKAVAGKDIPYGWYVITNEGIFGSFDKTTPYSYLRVVDKNGKEIEDIIPNGMNAFVGIMLYIPNGATVTAADITLTPAPNGILSTFTSTKNRGMFYTQGIAVQTMLVSDKGYGIKPGTYNVTVDTSVTEVSRGRYIYVIPNYFKTARHDNSKCGCIEGTMSGMVTDGKWVYHTIADRPSWSTDTAEYCNNVAASGYENHSEAVVRNTMPEKNNTPSTIKVNEGDLVICYGVTLDIQ